MGCVKEHSEKPEIAIQESFGGGTFLIEKRLASSSPCVGLNVVR